MPRPPPRRNRRSMGNNRKKVLVVDDQAIIRRVVRAYLETVRGLEVSEAGNGLEAVKLLLASDFDLIITDMIMPEMTGLELLGYLRSDPKLAAVPVIMLTSQEDEPDRRKAAALGVKDYLIKPFNPLAIKAVVDRCFPKD